MENVFRIASLLVRKEQIGHLMEDYSVELTDLYPQSKKIKDAALAKNWSLAEESTVTLILTMSSLAKKFRELQKPTAEVIKFKK
jgi:hypothetical protein